MKRKILAFALGIFLISSGGVLSLHAAESGRCVPHYNVAEVGGDWDRFRYRLTDGTLVKDAFVFDGMHTYYVQSDGTEWVVSVCQWKGLWICQRGWYFEY